MELKILEKSYRNKEKDFVKKLSLEPKEYIKFYFMKWGRGK